MNSKPKILVLLPDLPYPITSGGQMRMAPVLQILAKHAKLHCVVFSKSLPEETRDWIQKLPSTISYSTYNNRKSLHKILFRLQILFKADNLHFNKNEALFVSKEVENFNPDLIWIETPYQIKYALKYKTEIPILVDYWGLSEGNYREFKVQKGIHKIKQLIYYRAALKAEKKYASKVPYLLGISSHISSKLEAYAPKSKVFTMPSGIAKPISIKIKDTQKKENYMLMTGDFSFQPNIDAALYFVEKIFPIVRSKIPSATIEFAGKNPSVKVQNLRSIPGVNVTGFIPDLLTEIAKCTLYVLPLRMGSGIRSKLFDVFPLAKPIVLTSIAAEGLELFDNENCRIADNEEQFALRCIELLQNPNECKRLGKSVSTIAETIYSLESMEKKTIVILDEIFKKPK